MNRRVTVTAPPLSAWVWRAARPMADAEAAPAPSVKALGAAVGGRVEVRAQAPAGGFNQVTFAWRSAAGSDWTVLGTDDNPPYRVFHDVRGLAPGTPLDYRVVLRDHSGNIAAGSTTTAVS